MRSRRPLTPSSPTILPHSLTGLLKQLRNALPPTQFDEALDALAHEFGAQFPREKLGDEVSKERMDRIVAFLNERGYLARWEEEEISDECLRSESNAGEEESNQVSYLLHKCNCPYSGITAEHNELCIMDLALVEYLLGQECERIHSLAHDAPCCTYRISVPATEREETATESIPAV